LDEVVGHVGVKPRGEERVKLVLRSAVQPQPLQDLQRREEEEKEEEEERRQRQKKDINKEETVRQ
jgi:hypothetical protein